MATKYFKMEWEGLKRVDYIIQKLGRGFTLNEQMQAYRYGLKPVKDEMRERIPRNLTGNLYESIAISEDKTQRKIRTVAGFQMVETSAIVGSRRGRGIGKQGWHSHLLEWGVKPHDITAGPGKLMPIFDKSGFTGDFAKTIRHKGVSGKKIFSKSIESKDSLVFKRITDKFEKILQKNMK